MKILVRSLRFVPMVLIMGTIFFLSHQAGTELPFSLLPGLDKLAHAVIYALLAASVLFGVSREVLQVKPFKTGVLVVFICLLYGLTDEYHQTFIPGREASLGDLTADVVGPAVLVYFWLKYNRFILPGSKQVGDDANPISGIK